MRGRLASDSSIILKMAALASGDKSDDLEKVFILDGLSDSDDGLDGDVDVYAQFIMEIGVVLYRIIMLNFSVVLMELM